MRRHASGIISRTVRPSALLTRLSYLPSVSPSTIPSSSSRPLSRSLQTLKLHTPPISVKSASYTRAELERLLANIPQQPALPKRPLPILSIGAGNIVQVAHYPSYKAAGFTVLGITDLHLPTAESTAATFGIPHVYPTVQAMVDAHRSGEQRVVYDIAVPAKAILSVLELLPPHSYALIQKPMGETMAEARAIRDLCARRHISAAINFQLRTAAYSIATKELIRQGVIGDVTGIDFRVNVRTPWETWPFLEQASRMEVIYHSVHYIDFLRDLYGDPQMLHCMTYRHVDNPHLHSVRSNLLFLYSPTVQATIHTNHGHRWGLDHAESFLKVEGTKGAIKLQMGGNIAYPRSDLDYLKVVTDETKGEWLDVGLEGSWFPGAFKGPMAAVMRFAGGEIDKMPTSVEDACRTMAVCEAAYVSAEHLTPIQYE